MKTFIITIISLSCLATAQAGNEYIIRDAAAANALYASLGASNWPDQRGWPLPTGWQTGTGPSINPSCILAWKDTVYATSDGTRREMWVQYFAFRSNKTGGVIPSKLSFPYVESIDFYLDSTVTGSFPDFTECPRLKRFIFWGARVEDTLPELHHPLLEDFSISNTRMTGSIPKLDCPKMKYFSISSSRFWGTFANQSWPLAEAVRIKGSIYPQSQQFSGPFPALLSPKLRELDASDNAFTGPLPDLEQWPDMQDLNLSGNEMHGPLPSSISLPKARSVTLSRNPLGGKVPILNMPLLEHISLMTCQLQGTLPSWSLPKLQGVSLDHNKLRSPIPSMSCPNLTNITISDNELVDLPQMSSIFPLISTLGAHKNKLGFDDLERNIDLKTFTYADQDSIELIREVSGERVIYRVNTPGTKNLYYWSSYGTMDLTGQENQDHVNVPKNSDDGHIVCTVRNELFPDLSLHTRLRPARPSINPLTIGNLIFRGEASEWEPSADDPTYSLTGSLSVNDFLWFDGSIEIDTESVSVTAQGMFYLKAVPLPGGGTGTFVLSQGSYSLKLLGSDGKITDFANDALSKLPKIGGVSLLIDEIKLVGGATARGISIDGTITIDGLANGCSEGSPGATTLKISGLEYTRTDGFSVSGLSVNDLGFKRYPKFCLKELTAEYDREQDKLSFGVQAALPFAEVGAGLALILDKVDSIAWRIEATEHAVPIGSTNLGISGFFGSISGIESSPLNVELGGVFVTMVPKDWVKFDLAGTYTAPSTIGAKIDGVAIPSLGEEDQYQLKLKGGISHDFAEGLTKMEGEAHLGTTDGEEYFLDGALKVDMKSSTLALKGEISGGYMIRPFGEEDADEYPYDWINAKLGLPKKFETEAQFVFIRSRMLFGTAHLGSNLGDIRYVFDFRKNWRDPDFLFWERTPAKEELTGNDVQGIQATRTVVIAPNTSRMVVRVKGASTLPSSTLTMPDGTVITGTNAGKQIDYTAVTASKKAFWTVLEPPTGRWLVNVPMAGANDAVEIFVDELPAPFQITTSQQQRSVTVTWTPRGTIDDSVGFFVAGTGTSADGLPLGAASLLAGTTTISIPSDLPVCSFNVEAQGTEGMNIVADTSATQISVTMGTVTTPSMMIARYYTSQHLLNITWTPSAVSDTKVKSYVVVARNNGKERLLGEVFRWVGWVSVPYTRQNGDKVYVRGVDASGRMGCPTEITQITTDVAEEPSTPTNGTMIVPHPVDQRSEVRFVNTSSGPTSIIVTDLQGRSVMTVFNGWLDAGPNVIGLGASNVPSGMYVVTVRGNNDVQQVPMVVAH